MRQPVAPWETAFYWAGWVVFYDLNRTLMALMAAGALAIAWACCRERFSAMRCLAVFAIGSGMAGAVMACFLHPGLSKQLFAPVVVGAVFCVQLFAQWGRQRHQAKP